MDSILQKIMLFQGVVAQVLFCNNLQPNPPDSKHKKNQPPLPQYVMNEQEVFNSEYSAQANWWKDSYNIAKEYEWCASNDAQQSFFRGNFPHSKNQAG